MKRIVSFVPSWTETLIEAGANVVGRTRFCIHPADRVRAVEGVGGTKSFDEDRLRALAPDLIVMDREENTLAMFEAASLIAPVVATHVTCVEDMPRELRALAAAIGVDESPASGDRDRAPESGDSNGNLLSIATRFDSVLSKPTLHNGCGRLSQVCGKTDVQTEFIYLIWKDPWMCVGPNTFIASMLAQAGYTKLWSPSGETKYPTLDSIPSDKQIFLSSEPYPFAKKTPDLPNQNVAIVDGESFSWFGLRALRFLESIKN